MKPTLREEIIEELIGVVEPEGYIIEVDEVADLIMKLIQKRIPFKAKGNTAWVGGWNDCIAEMKEEING